MCLSCTSTCEDFEYNIAVLRMILSWGNGETMCEYFQCKVGDSKKSRGKLASQLSMKYCSRSWPIRLNCQTWYSSEYAAINGNVAMQGHYGFEYLFIYGLGNAVYVNSVIKLYTGNLRGVFKSVKLIFTEKIFTESINHNYSDRCGWRNKQYLSNSIACSCRGRVHEPDISMNDNASCGVKFSYIIRNEMYE